MDLLIISTIFFSSILLAVLCSQSYQRHFLKQQFPKKSIFTLFYPISLFFTDQLLKLEFVKKSKRQEFLKEIYVGANIEIENRLYLCKKIATACLVFTVINLVGIITSVLSEPPKPFMVGNEIERPSYGEDSKRVSVNVLVKDDTAIVEKEIELEVEPRQYTGKAFEAVIKELMPQIEKKLLGQNKSFDCIEYPLSLISSISSRGIKVRWSLGKERLVLRDGTLNNSNIEGKGAMTTITATFTSGKEKILYEFPLFIVAKKYSKEEQMIKQMSEEIKKQQLKSQTEEALVLPKQLEEMEVTYTEDKKESKNYMWLYAILLALLVSVAMEKQLVAEVQKREIQIMLDYPEIVNKTTLLMGAGMTMKGAWKRVVKEYETKRALNLIDKRYAYEEMILTCKELDNGVGETKAYESFGRRMKLLPYLKFSSLLAMNVKKGMQGLTNILQEEAISAFENRKELAKRLGEQAGTKLLVPMIIFMFIVFAIIMIPAVMTM